VRALMIASALRNPHSPFGGGESSHSLLRRPRALPAGSARPGWGAGCLLPGGLTKRRRRAEPRLTGGAPREVAPQVEKPRRVARRRQVGLGLGLRGDLAPLPQLV